jgi:hypothetical protein
MLKSCDLSLYGPKHCLQCCQNAGNISKFAKQYAKYAAGPIAVCKICTAYVADAMGLPQELSPCPLLGSLPAFSKGRSRHTTTPLSFTSTHDPAFQQAAIAETSGFKSMERGVDFCERRRP